MLRYGMTPFLALFVICSFCGGEFKSIGRHAWRCKEKLKAANNEDPRVSENQDPCISSISTNLEGNSASSNCSNGHCCCGKICNGLRGVKMHQRSCRIIKSLENETFESAESCDSDTGQDTTGQEAGDIDWNSLPNIKPGITKK